MLQLCGAVIEWNTEKSSRKNVFQVNTYLLLMAYALWLFKIDGTEMNWFFWLVFFVFVFTCSRLKQAQEVSTLSRLTVTPLPANGTTPSKRLSTLQ